MGAKRTEMIDRRTQKHRDAAARAYDGFVRTPAALASDLVEGHRDAGSTPRGARWLEPSAGDGRIVRAILDNDRDAHVVAVEPNGGRADALDALAVEFPGRVTVVRARFEDYAETYGGDPFDGVVMNPPFGDSSRDLVWIDHIRAAWELLYPGAVLVSIVPPSYASSGFRAHRAFRTWAEGNGATFEQLPGQPFAESGTGARAGVLSVPRPMPARPDGLPSWLYAPAQGAPVAVRGLPAVTSVGALTTPVQEYDDFSDGSRPRVLRYAGQCHACGRCCWAHDDRHDAAPFEASTVDAGEHAAAGPSVVLCLEHGTCGEGTAAALAAAAQYWTPDPDADPLAPIPGDDRPTVYPLDLGAGNWATVRGSDARGWMFTITGRVMADPERVEVPGAAFPHDRVAVQLRTARGVDVELYPLEDSRVIVRNVLADAVPAPCGGPVPFGLPQPVAGRPLSRPDDAERLADTAEMAAHHKAAADNARAHLADGSTVAVPAPAVPAPFVSRWSQLTLPVEVS
jgi:hypothetical protein